LDGAGLPPLFQPTAHFVSLATATKKAPVILRQAFLQKKTSRYR
jgi:hypothetical protein